LPDPDDEGLVHGVELQLTQRLDQRA